MAGLVGLGQAYKADNRALLEDVTRRENERKQVNEGISRQNKVQTISNVAMGAGLGFELAGPYGAAAGAAGGLLVSLL